MNYDFLEKFPIDRLYELPYSEKLLQKYYYLKETKPEIKEKSEKLKFNLENKLLEINNVSEDIPLDELKSNISEVYNLSYFYSLYSFSSPAFSHLQKSSLEKLEQKLLDDYGQICTYTSIEKNKIIPHYKNTDDIFANKYEELVGQNKVLKFLTYSQIPLSIGFIESIFHPLGNFLEWLF